jgi:hypothetical protein
MTPRVCAVAALVIGLLSACGTSHTQVTLGRPITLAQFDSLPLGESEAQVMAHLGPPESRLEVAGLGFIHEEPKQDRCVYYRRQHPDTGDAWSSSDTFQLCFKGSQLRYKWAYIAARA